MPRRRAHDSSRAPRPSCRVDSHASPVPREWYPPEEGGDAHYGLRRHIQGDAAGATGGGASADRDTGAKGIGLGAGGGTESGVEASGTTGGTMGVVPSFLCGKDTLRDAYSS